MSGKSAKRARQALATVKLPTLNETHTAPVYGYSKPGYAGKEYNVEADHNRRIRQLARRMNITVAQAIPLYTAKMRMAPKPKN